MKSLKIIDLEKAMQSSRISNDDKKIISILLDAVNDWPNQVSNLEDYELDVKKFVGGITRKEAIAVVLKNCNLSINAWQAESLFQIMSIFEYYNANLSLAEIIEDLKNKINT